MINKSANHYLGPGKVFRRTECYSGIDVNLLGVARQRFPVAFRAFQARVSFTLFDVSLIVLVLTGTVVTLAYRDESSYPIAEMIAAGVIVSAIAMLFLFLHGVVRLLAYRWCGVPVYGLRIDFTGDNPDVSGDRSNPAIELCVGLTGIATCLTIAALSLYVHYGWAVHQSSSLVEVATTTLILVSLIFALLQMTPGISQDGGQIVRGAFWYFSGSPMKGALVTGRFGQTFGAVVILCLGLSLFVSFNFILGIGVVVVAIQLALLARNGARYLGWQFISVDQSIELRQIVEHPGYVIASDDNVADRFEMLANHPDSSYLVIDPTGEARGIVNATNVHGLSASNRRKKQIVDVMTPIERVRSFPGEWSASAAWETLRQIGGSVAVVTSNGLPTDIVTLDQLRRRLVVMSHAGNQ